MTRSPPSDADYHDIEAAIVDMRHGDWFLQEYAKRQRQADTDRLTSAIGHLHRESSDNERVWFNLFVLDRELSNLQQQLGSSQMCEQCAAMTEQLSEAIQRLQNQIAELITSSDTNKLKVLPESPDQAVTPTRPTPLARDLDPTSSSGGPDCVATSLQPQMTGGSSDSSTENLIGRACAWLQQLEDSVDIPKRGDN